MDKYEFAKQLYHTEYGDDYPFGADPYVEEVDPSELYYAAKGSSMKDVETWDEFFKDEPDRVLGEREENSWTEYCDVNSPNHYKKDGFEVIDIIDGFTPDPYSAYMANVIKYVLRHLDKGHPKKDLRKAKWYLDRMIKDWEK